MLNLFNEDNLARRSVCENDLCYTKTALATKVYEAEGTGIVPEYIYNVTVIARRAGTVSSLGVNEQIHEVTSLFSFFPLVLLDGLRLKIEKGYSPKFGETVSR